MSRWTVYIGAITFLESTCFIVSRLQDVIKIDALTWIALCFAANRFGRAVAFNGVGEPFRWFFSEVKADSSGAGEGIEPKGKGWKHGFGELLTCPICSGTWSAVLILNLYLMLPLFGKIMIFGFGAAGVSELIHNLNEAYSWKSRHHREYAGSQVYKKVPPTYLSEPHKIYQQTYLKGNGDEEE